MKRIDARKLKNIELREISPTFAPILTGIHLDCHWQSPRLSLTFAPIPTDLQNVL